MRTNFRAFFNHSDVDIMIPFQTQLLEPDRSSQASRSGANDDDVIFHRFSGHGSIP